MRYMLLIYGDESRWESWTEAETQADMERWYAYGAELDAANAQLAGEALQPTATATSVRDEEGKPLVTDGPFAETKEQLAGFYMIEADDLDAAIAWAHKCPAATYGTIEVRPIMEFPTG